MAIKILEKKKIQEKNDIIRVAKEISILRQLNHTNLIHLYDVFYYYIWWSNYHKVIETQDELYLIMEYLPGGELYEFIVKNQKFFFFDNFFDFR